MTVVTNAQIAAALAGFLLLATIVVLRRNPPKSKHK